MGTTITSRLPAVIEHSLPALVETPMKPQNEIAWPLLEDGQVWQMNDTTCRIGHLGKKLVHFITFKGQPTHNAPIVTNKEVLTKYLQEMKAVLVQGQKFAGS